MTNSAPSSLGVLGLTGWMQHSHFRVQCWLLTVHLDNYHWSDFTEPATVGSSSWIKNTPLRNTWKSLSLGIALLGLAAIVCPWEMCPQTRNVKSSPGRVEEVMGGWQGQWHSTTWGHSSTGTFPSSSSSTSSRGSQLGINQLIFNSASRTLFFYLMDLYLICENVIPSG